MKKVTPHKRGLVAVLVLLALLTYLRVHRRGLTEKEAENEAVGAVVKLKDMVIYDRYAPVAILALVAMFAFVAWTVLRANKGEDKSIPPATRDNST
jgi:hypothetical protein